MLQAFCNGIRHCNSLFLICKRGGSYAQRRIISKLFGPSLHAGEFPSSSYRELRAFQTLWEIKAAHKENRSSSGTILTHLLGK